MFLIWKLVINWWGLQDRACTGLKVFQDRSPLLIIIDFDFWCVCVFFCSHSSFYGEYGILPAWNSSKNVMGFISDKQYSALIAINRLNNISNTSFCPTKPLDHSEMSIFQESDDLKPLVKTSCCWVLLEIRLNFISSSRTLTGTWIIEIPTLIKKCAIRGSV